jgi:hypothetical protein
VYQILPVKGNNKVDRGASPCYNIHMAHITITDHILYPDGSTIPISVMLTDAGCTISWLENIMNLTWEQMSDVEYLSTVFEDQTVRVFKVVVMMLGKIYTYKDVYFAAMDAP